MLRVGGSYTNSAGQVREILSIDRNVVKFRIVDPGPGDHRFSSLRLDQPFWSDAKGFENWAYQEVTP